MPILKEYRCLDCGGLFESMSQDPECPTCSAEEPERVFLTPPGIKSPQTARKDEIVRDLAASHGFSDMTNAGGAPVRRAPSANPAEFTPPSDSRAMAVLGKLGNAGDGLSAVLPTLRAAGTPRAWAKVPDRRA